ncbi:MAG: hypothetical protein AUG48_07590 [Actinobacteria bacterium 13_1_20CM_3_68_9]|nr:MAG: hypothetical protein AUG48_07590 [Actinobacteria bacterium 13_1_20CM_3_68_9]
MGDGPLRRRLESLAEGLALTGAVRFTGLRRDARPLIARSDVVAFSSDWEGLPMVALEALAAGVPVVSTEVEGMSELLGTGAGVVVPPDADALAREIVALIRAPDRRAQMGRTGRERIATEFSVERMVAAYQGLYRELASRGR